MNAVFLLFTFQDTGAKYLVIAGIAPLFVAWMRYATHLLAVPFLLQGWRNPGRFRAASLPAQALRSLMLFGSSIFNFMALQTLQLAETTSIAFFGPMVVTALAGPLLGEWAGWRRWMAILAGFVGVLIITRPGFGSFAVGHLYALCGMLSYCLYVIMTRRLSATETAESMILYSALVPVVLLLPALPLMVSLPKDALHWAVLLSIGVFGAIAHWFLIKAYQIATASALAPYPYVQMIWMIAAGWLVFDQLPDVWTLVGASVIVASGLYIIHREHRLRLTMSAAPSAEDEELAKKL
ncbi:MAG: DMT family transporter [Mesorhizobium sp.]|nr:DMT family transporter [Mesorhizobium sp.]MBL8578454.1 DMT family transporter [Mesorhizobium sp.]